ncbi:MAG: serine protease [Elusimicrobiales bacterium]|nr:serine protease [Elusimicrobiales bacterium]
MKALALFALPLLLAAPAAADEYGAKTIYGGDSRRDFYQVTDAAERSALPAAVSLFRDSALAASGENFAPGGQLLGHQSRGLCPGTRFFEQRSAAFCSGTLIAPDLVLTAGHCMGDKNKPASRCARTRFVFGFAVTAEGRQPGVLGGENVYSCAEVKLYTHDNTGDYAVVRLDRAVTGRRPARLYTAAPPAAGAPIFTIGGPYGLPLKVSDDAEVRSVSAGKTFFTTNLDTSGGNSGGGIFSARTGRLLGVHTASWDPDLVGRPLPPGHGLPPDDARVKAGKCKVISVFGQDDGNGKKGYALSAIAGLGALLAGGQPKDAVVDMPPVTEIPSGRIDLSGFGALP